MQPEFNFNVDVVKKKTRSQKEEALRYEYSERLFHGSLEQMSKSWNTPLENEVAESADDEADFLGEGGGVSSDDGGYMLNSGVLPLDLDK